ncbi:MAG: serine hydrolase [Nannocystaceae bacterium]
MRKGGEKSETVGRLLDSGCNAAFPGCVALVWRAGATRYVGAHGVVATYPGVPSALATTATVFDLASLTKVLCTTTLAAMAVGQGKVRLETPVPSDWAAACRGATLGDLLEHCAGFRAHREFFAELRGSAAYPLDLVRRAVETPAAYGLRQRSIYSDLGFIVLGAWLERLWEQGLGPAFRTRIAEPLGVAESLSFRSVATTPVPGVAPTEVYDVALHGSTPPSWFGARRHQPKLNWAQGQVHDDNAFVAGGTAGHAGLFGTAAAVLEVALAWVDAGRLAGLDAGVQRLFRQPSTVPASTRRKGWDGPTLDGSGSTGLSLSPRAFGHLGFTGTSLWVDPIPGDARVYILLSNRVHPTRANLAIRGFRRAFHGIAAEL